MRQVLVLACALLAAARAAHADGLYFAESAGLTRSHAALGAYVHDTLHMRVGVGVRLGPLAIEPWLSASLATDRDGAIYGVGGQPRAGGADLSAYGLDAKLIHALVPHLEVYVRGGPLYGGGTGVLGPYGGFGFGAGAGVQLSGTVRALGFLFAPLFWSKRGPLVTGAVFLDEGVDLYRLHADAMPGIASRVGHVDLGFAIGSAF